MITDKVSVIIPAYNREAYIRQTVDSVLNQTYPELELIVVDDGSSDSTREILESYGSRIKLLEHEGRVNIGQSAAINVGLEHADGEFIAILDSDDYWETNKLELQTRYLRANPDIGLVYANGTAVNQDGEYLYDIYKPDHEEKNITGSVLIDCYLFVPTNSLVRSEVFSAVGKFDESLRSGQDHDMAIRIAEVAKLGYMNEILFHYRRHQESISSRHADLRWRNGFIILENSCKRFKYPLGVIFQRKAVLHFRVYQCQFENKKYLSAAMHLLLAGIYNPLRAINVLLGREFVSSPH